ncbi:hypothetical protein P7K49_026548, partial [Saguinus oedipus]
MTRNAAGLCANNGCATTPPCAQCMVPGMNGHPGASAPAPVAVAFGIARAPVGPPSLGATPVRAQRSKRSSATLPCAL